jgi:transposase-like protein
MIENTFSLEDLFRLRVQEVLEELLEEELEGLLGPRYERAGRGHRNGHRPRELVTSFGPLSLDVPRARLKDENGSEQEFQSSILPIGKKLTPRAEALVVSAYLCGVNTRKVSFALSHALGSGVSRSMVGRCLRRLRPQWESWEQRDLSKDRIIRVILDALSVPVRMDGTGHRLSILVALGITASGERFVLSMKDMGGESTEAWLVMVRDLEARGVKAPELCIVDGCPGLDAAISQVWPKCLIQRCTVHKERNLLSYAPPAMHEELKADYKEMVYAPDAQAALRLRSQFLAKWHAKCPKVAKSLREAGDKLFTFLRFPPLQWRSIRTTNSIERLNEEFRRRIKIQGCTHSGESVCLLLWAMLASGILPYRKVEGHETFNIAPTAELELAA